MTGRRIGVLGGTFDPIHAAHLDLAETCLRHLDLDHVRFVTNRRAPHKPGAVASEADRHAMVALGTAGRRTLVADALELQREGASYTVETLRRLRDRHAGADLFFLAGSDSLRDLPTWRDWTEVLSLATFVVVRRAGAQVESSLARIAAAPGASSVLVLDHEPPPWSSSAIRAALSRGEDPGGALPPSVREYVDKNGLYRGRRDLGRGAA